ncbi:DUF3703 domain-containing protein [Pseudomonas sp. N040]|uniref:DUF3703 domain-containing protein n=1 Tax=Pseudomonas sp. N040 TaxID=2785325 RepID=UPI0018A31CCB|nr:DUF3703 domain-containing protein [Pseudomonas sp. N040]MBF7729148.1 DUF3703 domain-containing protein [Pseudomonas sp. N040]MBW7012788.1 DUF3703 domain-containing protein [Pseudomonas sp. N040]
MHNALQAAIEQAFAQARQAMRAGQADAAWPWLERAHILSQRLPLRHARAHWLMLRCGWQTGDYREVAGQLPRILAAVLFSLIWVPLGNTGRARVSAFAPMPLSAELQALLARDEH